MQKRTQSRFERTLVAIMLGALAGILVLMPAHAFLSTWAGEVFGSPLVWKSWKEIALLILLPVAAGYCLLRRDICRVLWARPYNKLIVGFGVLHIGMASLSTASLDAIIAGLLMNLRFFALFLVAQLVVEANPPWLQQLRQAVPRWLLGVVIGLGTLALLQVTVIPKDFLAHFGYDKDIGIAPYVLVDQNPDALRAFATTRGPNELGAFLLLPLAVGLYCLATKRWLWLSVPATLLGFAALLATGSRSAWLGFGLMIMMMGLLWLPRDKLIKMTKRYSLGLVALTALFVVAAVNVPSLRLAVFHSSPSDPHLFEGSTEQHWLATAAGVADIVEQPLGEGVGTAGPASYYNTNAAPNISENYIVQIGQEVGVLGMVLFIAICVLVVRRLATQPGAMPRLLLASFAGLSLVSIFLHTWADDLTALTWWGIAGLYLASNPAARNTKGSHDSTVL